MTDYKAIEILEHLRYQVGLPNAQGNKWSPNADTIAIDLAIQALEKQIKNETNAYTDWIPVEERLPTKIYESDGEPKEYIVQLIYGLVPTVGCLNSNGLWGYMDWNKMQFNAFSTKVIAWMPLPKSYKE